MLALVPRVVDAVWSALEPHIPLDRTEHLQIGCRNAALVPVSPGGIGAGITPSRRSDRSQP